jgi:hypothetical protein
MKYRVYIDANPHQMDTSQRTLHGDYDTPEGAVAAAREVVRTRLVEEHRPGMKADELLRRFAQRGETAFIMPMDASTLFDGNDYARECAERLCWREELRD